MKYKKYKWDTMAQEFKPAPMSLEEALVMQEFDNMEAAFVEHCKKEGWRTDSWENWDAFKKIYRGSIH